CSRPVRRWWCRGWGRPAATGRRRGAPGQSPPPAARYARTGRARPTGPWACTRSRTPRCRDRRLRRLLAAWRPRTARPWRPRGSRRPPRRSARRTRSRPRDRCRRPRPRRPGIGYRRRSRRRPGRGRRRAPRAAAVVEGLELAVGQHGLEGDTVGGAEVGAHVVVLGFAPARIVEPEGDLSPQRIGDLEVAAEESARLGPPSDRDEVEELDEEPG